MGENSNASRLAPIWKNIWSLKVPKKIRIFTWRACMDKLPTLHGLVKKWLPVNNWCHFYSQLGEDLLHAVFGCPKIWIWWSKCFPMLEHSSKSRKWLELVTWLMENGSKEDLTLFTYYSWRLWSRRNWMVHEGKGANPMEPFEMLFSVLAAYISHQEPSQIYFPQPAKWIPL